jgi:hypothetical protein
MPQPYFESTNVNDILSVAQKQTVLNKLRTPQQYHPSFKDCAWVPFYQNDANNPTNFKQEMDATIPNLQNATWPASLAAEDNPFGIEAVQGQPVFTTAEKALFANGSLSYDGWTENYGIGV